MKNILLIILSLLPLNALATSYVCSKAIEVNHEMPEEHINVLIEEDPDGFYGVTVNVSSEISGQPLEAVMALISSGEESNAEYIFPIHTINNSINEMFVLYVKKPLLGNIYLKISYVKRKANCVEGGSVYSAKIT